jgi:uncharacterized protein
MDDPILWTLPFIGLVGGFLSGLLGLGGGVALLPLLTWVGRVPLKVATGTTLVQVIIAAATGVTIHYRGGRVNLRVGFVLGISGIVGGLVGSFLSVYLSTRFLEWIFLVVVGIAITLFSTQRKLYDHHDTRRDFKKVTGSLIGFGVGSLTGLLGVGGGFIIIPLMIYCLDIPLRVAIGTSLLVILISSVGTLAVKYGIGQVHLLITLLVISGSVIGALLGAHASRRMAVRFLRLALLIILVSIFLTAGYKVVF